jgi:hypothetical protein
MIGWLPSSSTFYYSGKNPGETLGFCEKMRGTDERVGLF